MTIGPLQFYDENIPCLAACPVHTNAGAYVAAIADGEDEFAYLTARLPNPFASVCGRVCAAPCEDECRRGEIDRPIAIRALKRFVTERYGVEAGSDTYKKVAGAPLVDLPYSVGIVGGGPTGLSAAHDLRRLGYKVTVYEATGVLGGMMVLGIPEYRLDRSLLAAEIQAIIDMGVDVQLNTRLGADVTLGELRERHDAVFLSYGAFLGRGLDIPGGDADGVLKAVEFLLNTNQGFEVDIGENVIVIGGGDVAMDAARTALRRDAYESRTVESEFEQVAETAAITEALDVARTAARAGATHVKVISLESVEELPASEFELEEAINESISFVHRRGPARILTDAQGRLTGLETIGVLSVFDEDGRFAPKFDHDDVQLHEADTIILAIGQAVDVEALGPDGPQVSPRKTIQIDPDTLETSIPMVWAGGDAAKGPRTLILGIADGRIAAAQIHKAFGGEIQGQQEGQMVQLEQFHRLDDIYDRIGRIDVPTIPTDRRIGLAEVETGFTEEMARCEAKRCLRCFANILLDASKCVLCALCADVCPIDVISLIPAEEVGVGLVGSTALMFDERACIRCALCIERCPTDALSMGLWTGVGVPRVGVRA
ncbi:MAG TPA: 4Fe-4S dicluster domain-containing protein [Actinobacteria bacterium]|nr:NAD-dependent dihydropyrimidine dehydrogenase subunit PreT [bacterium BMS3Bbin01]HDH26401.1 4Fe-4S dicluster domain-containing protein [Actinomycetota bacterium]